MYYRPHSPNCSCSTVAARAFCSALVDDDRYFITRRHRGNEHCRHDAAGDIAVPSSSGPRMIVEEEYGGDVLFAVPWPTALAILIPLVVVAKSITTMMLLATLLSLLPLVCR